MADSDYNKKFKDYLHTSQEAGRLDRVAWKQNFKASATSKSLNKKVTNIYNEILENQFSDSDYWSIIGDGVIIDQFYAFEQDDWNELQSDLINWKPRQLELFSTILTSEYNLYKEEEEIVSWRSNVYGYILTLIDPLVNPFFLVDIMNNFEFLKLGGSKPKPLLDRINNVFNKLEAIPGMVQSCNNEMYYVGRTRFNYLKEILENIITISD